MIAKGSKKGTTRFALKAGRSVKSVRLAGNFNNWRPASMWKQKDGSFVSLVTLLPGTYEYKFLVDGDWQVDPDNHCWAANAYGTMNCVAEVS